MSTPNPLAELVAKELAARKADGWSKEPLPPKPPPPPIKRDEPDHEADRAKLGAIIVNLYLLKKRDHTVIEIYTHTTFTLERVTELLKELPEGVTSVMRKRGKERVRVYGPTREHLRDLLIKSETGRKA